MNLKDLDVWNIRVFVPFTLMNAVWRSLGKSERTILDVGCGKGEPMRIINRFKRFYSVGVDIFRPYLIESKRKNTHDAYLLCDVRWLPFRKRKFDAVICLEVLEHLTKNDGSKMISEMERIARKKVIITTPRYTVKQNAFDGNPYQEHISFWTPVELTKLGYQVRGLGLREIRGSGLMPRLLNVSKWLSKIVWILAGLFLYFFPDSAEEYVCWKRVTS